MKVDRTEQYVVLADDQGNYEAFAAHLDKVVPKQYEDDHLVIDLTSFDTLDLEELLLLLKLSTYQRSTKHSFVIVSTAIDIDDIPDELVVVPTLQEAADIIEMEAIERDLGF